MKASVKLMLTTVVGLSLITSTALAQSEIPIQNNSPVSNIGGGTGCQLFYKISVPSGQSILQVGTTGGTGDCDLYVRLGSRPTTTSYNSKSTGSGTTETVTINNPSSGTWYILLFGKKAFSGVTLLATYKPTGATWGFDTATAWGVLPAGWSDDSSASQRTYRATTFGSRTCLQIKTTGNTWDRVKARTATACYMAGTYEWKVYVPAIDEPGASSSIGAFLYSPQSVESNKVREIDFEIGYGKFWDRIYYRIPSGKLMCYMTVQRDDSTGDRTHLFDPLVGLVCSCC
jgi:hypothetical protein